LFKKVHVFRIKPGQELVTEINRYCNEHKISSGVIIGIIGSLKNATLSYLIELPGKYQSVDYQGPLEIVCSQGSIALKDNSPIIHIHTQLCEQANCHGGHLAAATVFSTAEVIIGELDYQLRREFNNYTGLNELTD
jgi:predicted DNA-binding protein with PD1-like motif